MDSRTLNNFGKAGALGSIGSGIASLFFGGNNNNPYDAASSYFNKIPGTVSPYYQPYINAGNQAMGQLQGQYGNLVNDPTAMLNQIGKGYQQSPGFQFQMNQAQQAAGNAAAAGGMLGSPQHQYQSADLANNLANQDYWNYVNHGLNQYQTGLQGLGGLNQMGFQGSTDLAQLLGSNMMNQGNLAFAGEAAQNQSKGQGIGDLFGGLGSLAAFAGLF